MEKIKEENNIKYSISGFRYKFQKPSSLKLLNISVVKNKNNLKYFIEDDNLDTFIEFYINCQNYDRKKIGSEWKKQGIKNISLKREDWKHDWY